MSEAFETLPPSEWGRLKEIFVRDFGTDEMPDPERTEVRVRFDEKGDVACFYLLERVMHGGPFWTNPKYRRLGLAREMAEDAFEQSKGYEGYIAATVPAAEHLAESMGLIRVSGTLWCKERSDVR